MSAEKLQADTDIDTGTDTRSKTDQNLESDSVGVKPEGLISYLQTYIQKNLSDFIILTILTSLTVIKFFMDAQLTSLYFFFIVVLGTGYAPGKRFAVLTAFLTILIVWAFILSDKTPFLIQYRSDILNLYMTLWSGFLVLTGWLGSALAKSIHGNTQEVAPANYSAI